MLAVAAGAVVAGLVSYLRPGTAASLPRGTVILAAVSGAVALGLSSAAPTGWEPLDLGLRFGFGALVPAAAARAGPVPTTWLLAIGAAVAVIAEPPGAVLATMAAGAYLAIAVAGEARSGAAAVAALAAVGSMAHVDWPVTTGASTAAMVVGTAPVLVVALGRTSTRVRGRIVAGSAITVVVLGLGAAAGLVSALGAKGDVGRAVSLATLGIDSLGDDPEAARGRLRLAADRFDDARRELRAWWARPALLVPGVAQQSRAVSTMASTGADLARTAATASEEADIDSVRPRAGRVDLRALQGLGPPLRRSMASLRRAGARLESVDNPWLLGPVADRLDDLRVEVDDAEGDAELASQAVAVAPALLGADGLRRYFVAFQTPSEQRANGGFMGSWAELTAEHGLLRLTRSGRLRELTDAGVPAEQRQIAGEPEFTRVYGAAGRLWGLHNSSPDNPTVSRVTAELYPQSGGADLDGVIHLTPAAIAGFLELTGPVQVDGYPQALTAENAERILLHDQYLEFPQDLREDREAFLSDAVEAVFDELTSGDLPGPRTLADELGPAVAGRDLQLWAARPREQALFRRIGADGSADRGETDSFGVVTQNYNGNKIDWFLHRSIDYGVEWDPATGAVSGSMSVVLDNRAPSTGLPSSIIGWGGDVSDGQVPVADGENLMSAALYSTFPISGVSIDGREAEYVEQAELGHHTARLFVSVPPQSSRRIVLEFRGRAAPGAAHAFRLLRQPMVNPDLVSITVAAPAPWSLRAPGDRAGDRRIRLEDTSASPVVSTIRASLPHVSRPLFDRLRGKP